jgi:hypothetical protein
VTGAGPEPEESVNLPELLGGFRPSRGGGATARFGTVEAANIRYLVGQVVELLGGDTLDEEPPDDRPAGPSDGPDDGLPSAGDLAAMIGLTENSELPSDPALARLLPDAYRDDPEASGEFRRYTEQGLRSGKVAAARTVLATLPPKGGRVRLTGDQARDWLRALNDVRLMFGVRLEVTEDFEEQLAALNPEDPKVAAFEVYGWLGAVQESLVQALARLADAARQSKTTSR